MKINPAGPTYTNELEGLLAEKGTGPGHEGYGGARV